MMNLKTTVIGAVLGSYAATVGAGTMYLTEVAAPEGQHRYRVDRADVDPDEYINDGVSQYSVVNYFAVWPSTPYTQCGAGPVSGRFCGEAYPAVSRCLARGEVTAAMASLVGFTMVVIKGGPPTEFKHVCSALGYPVWRLETGRIVIRPALASCTGTAAEIKIQGRVGERATNTTDVYIHCDSRATLRLSIPDAGLVRVAGGGEVQLKFTTTGEAVGYVTGTDPQISIDAELTKSPTTAGTYRGSTVLLLDVL